MQKYDIGETVSVGSTGIVKKTKNMNFAIKILTKTDKNKKDVMKEIKIHKSLDHKNIIKFIEDIEDETSYYLVMDLAKNELFDFIEPDIGMDLTLIHFYFKQLIAAITYLHTKGICHRDIKPENILLDNNGNLQLSDFGFSTLFIHKKERRRLFTILGSYTYMAPEILNGSYEGDLVDIWSAGMVLLVMSSGVTPWEKPSTDDKKFDAYIKTKFLNYSPFISLNTEVLKIFKQMCSIDEKQRISLKSLKNIPWFSKRSNLMDENGLCANKEMLYQILYKDKIAPPFSQPEKFKGFTDKFISSQPVCNTFDLPMMKRIYLEESINSAMPKVIKLFESMIVPYELDRIGITFNTVDSKRNTLSGSVSFIKMMDFVCISFTRLRGDCIEFKKFFNFISEKLSIDNSGLR
ncbi:CAMK/CAMKL/CHK1 protein kinase [Hamiltosporidium tvaerminnensis]|uniref:non-specific serine/threonine protein kinase n=1 Tax=Hamiltosporidium tvaerminnensis TaxID=1176355 RepID=A0A4Q9L0J8_9MICR|nr:CAMK/CAMKL/CHK1 protein kinase [Hamiltosporidium tvaerminnensis]